MNPYFFRALKYSTNVTGIVASISILLNICYEAMFYLPLNLSYNEMPTAIADYFRGAINWVPATLVVFIVSWILNSTISDISVKSTSGKTIIDGNIIFDVYNKIIFGTSLIIILLHFAFGEILVSEGAYNGAFFFVWLGAAFDFIKNSKQLEVGHKAMLILASTVLAVILFRGYSEGITVRDGKLLDYCNVFQKNNDKPYNAAIVRAYDKFILIKLKGSTSVTLIPVSEISKIEKFKKDNPKWKDVIAGLLKI